MAKINVVSPYFINISSTNLTSVQLEIETYFGGANVSWQSSPQYTLTSTAVNEKVTFEISELIKDYILTNFKGTYPSSSDGTVDEATTINVDYRVTEYISGVAQTPVDTLGERAFYGYGYFEDGANPQFAQGYLQSNTTILKLADSPIRIPVDNENMTSVAFFYNGEQTYSFTPSVGLKIEDQIRYLSNEVSGADSYRDRVLLDGGTYEDNSCIQDFLDEYEVYEVDTVYVSGTEGVSVINVQTVEECKYTPYKLTFINKFGAYQDLWMFKRSNLALATTEQRYKRNIISDGSYNTYEHQNIILTKNGKQSLTLNSGYYPESNNEVFKQLSLSEKVWIEYDYKTLPVIITSKSLGFKTSVNNKLIDYTIQVEFAYETINNVR